MAKQCAICGKKTVTGRRISHAHNVTSRTWQPNLQRIRTTIDGVTRRAYVCTRCLRSGKAHKPAVRNWKPDEAPPQP